MPATRTSDQLDLEEFLAAVRRSRLLTETELERAAAGLPADTRTGRQAAGHLVRVGALTRFQADRLLAGKADGFHLGPYVILEPLGQGKMGRAYTARHRTMNRLVAVEILPPDQSRTAADREAFHREARAAARLAHPNLVTVLDADEVGDRLYLVLEYVDGASLDEVVRAQGPLPVARACEYARQAALGLAHAHEKGMPHGGLSPAAVLVGRPGGKGPAGKPTVKVLNVGLTRLALFAAKTGDLHAAAAAAEYLAPEQLTAADRADPACDLYALGCILYFSLTGRPPRPAGVAAGLLLHQLGEATPVEHLRPDVPPGVAALVRGLMAKDPAARPRSAAEVVGHLTPFAESSLDSSHVDFALPPAAGPGSSGGAGFLSGLHAPDGNPFADLDAAPAAAEGPDSAPPEGRALRRAAGGPGLGVIALAAAIILAVGTAVAVVLRSVAH